MATLRRYFAKKISKDIDKNLDGKYSVTDEFSRQGSAVTSDGASSGNNETGERRRMRSVSISRSGRFKQKKRERGALQDRPDLYQNPPKQDAVDDQAIITGGDKKQPDNTASTHKQTTHHNYARKVPSNAEGVNLYQNQTKYDLVNESSTDEGIREKTLVAAAAAASHKQTTASNSNNNNSINSKIGRSGHKGPETSGRFTTTVTMV